MPPGIIRDLTERRVPQFLAVYLGASFGLIEFVDFISTRYMLAPRWTDLTLLALALLLPSVLLYTYHHGRPGRDQWQRSEKIFIPANVLVLVAALFFVGASSNLSAVTTRVTMTDEKGNTIEAIVPNKAYRKRVAMFAFDVAAGGATDALRLGVPILVQQDLQQQQFIQLVAPQLLRTPLRQAGHANGMDVPLSLKRNIASEMHIPHFVTGTIETTPNGLRARVQLYETASAKLISEHSFTAGNAGDVADLISAHLISALDIPVIADAKPDMPVTELTTKNPDALNAYLEAIAAILTRDDWVTAKKNLDEAVRLDPTFAYAQVDRATAAMYMGAPQDSKASMQAALDHSYRLPERMQQYVKANYFAAQQDFPRAYAVFDMLGKLYPDDIEIQEALVSINANRDDRDAMITTMNKVLELDPSRGEMLHRLGRAYEIKGDANAALKQYQAYAKRYPNEVASQRMIGSLYSTIGEHAKARAAFEEALLVAPRDVETLALLAALDRNLGNFEAAEQRLNLALEASKTPQDRATALDGMADLYEFTGEIGKSVELLEAVVREYAEFQPPQLVLVSRMGLPGKKAMLDPAKAEADLAAMRKQLTPPWDLYLPMAEIGVYDVLEDANREEEAVKALDAVIEKTKLNSMRAPALLGRGRVNELRGNCEEAIRWYRERQKLNPLAISSSYLIGRCYRKLGRKAEAEKALRHVLAVAPAHGRANLELALLYKATGDAARAQQHADRVRGTWKNADPRYRYLKDLNGI